MKKKMLFLTSICAMTSCLLGGCGTVVEEEIDETKTQLKVKYTNGGFGSKWLDILMDEFEESFKNYSFEQGKTGVQIIPEYDKRNVGYESIRGNQNHLFIQEDTDYYTYISKNVLKDISDVMNAGAVTGVDANGNILRETNRKISDKVDANYTAFYKYTDNKFYGLPLFETNVGIQYNVGVFEQKKLFFKEGATAEGFSDADFENQDKINSLFIVRKDDTRSLGPDGKTGIIEGVNYSIDDGLPATYKDFRALLKMMMTNGVTPFIWNNTCTNYLTSLINDVWATNEGADQFKLNFTFDGTATNLVKLNNGAVTSEVESKQISVSNRAELQLQKGKLEALKFAEYLVQPGAFYSNSWSTGYTDAQEYFIHPKDHTIGDIGFIVEGGWWFREATDMFKPGEQETAKFSPFILPKVDASRIGTPNVRVSDRRSLMFISNYVEGATLEVAKLFLSFLQSDHALETYTKYTCGNRAMIYDISDEAYNSMSYYGKAAWDISRNTNTVTLPWLPLTNGAKEKVLEMDYAKYGFSLDSNDGNPVMNFYDWNKKGTPRTAEQYFVDIYNFKKL